MRIVCLVKVVPDVESFEYDYERNVLVRDNVHLVINPEDATALAHALAVKAEVRGASVETVTMAPRSCLPHLEDLVRRGVDRAHLVADPVFIGSDTWATARVLSRALETIPFDCILAGTHTLDGGTAHVGAQIAEALNLPHLAHIVHLDHGSLATGRAVVEVDAEDAEHRFSVPLPAVLGFAYSTRRTLPYISRENLSLDVSGRVSVVTNAQLAFRRDEVGLEGSLTTVARVDISAMARTDAVVVRPDDEGIETVYRFLRSKGFVR